MVELLILLLIVVVGVVALSRNGSAKAAQQQARDRGMDKQRDARWLQYIASFRAAAETDDARRIIDTMVAGGTVNDVSKHSGADAAKEVSKTSAAISGVQMPQSTQATPEIELRPPAKPMDGTLLLLYFGAFLFVASVGLFVAFGEFSGAVRTLLVILTMAVLYGGGLWLHGHSGVNSGRLKPAGIAFVAIGLAIAPLVGVAAYNYLGTYPGETLDGRVIWLATSLLCIGLYAHALYRLRTSLLSYLFIFSFISLFESSISVLQVPAPYFIWGLIVVGLILKFVSLRRQTPLLDDPADQSAQLLVPLSTAGALFMLPEHGVGQMSVALSLSALYYSLEAYASKWTNNGYVAAAHVLSIAAIATGTFAIADSGRTVALVLLAVAALHAVFVYLMPPERKIVHNAATVAFGIPLVATCLAWPDGLLVTVGIAATTLMGVLIAVRQRRLDAFVGGVLGLIALPLSIGQLLAEPNFSHELQSAVSFSVAFGLLFVLDRFYRRPGALVWREPASSLFLLAATAAVLPAWLAGGWTAIVGSVVLSGMLAYLAKISFDTGTWLASGVVLCLPIVLSLGVVEEAVFTVAVVVALAGNLAIVIFRHNEACRWLVTGLGLLLPVAVGAGGLGFTWSAVGYAYAFLAVMAGLVVCRIVARSVIRTQDQLLSIFAGKGTRRPASYAYVAGYLTAAVSSVMISLTTDASRLHTSVILACLLGMSILLSLRVEEKREILVFSPWLAQALLFSVLRPGSTLPDDLAAGTLAIFISIMLGAGLYMLASRSRLFLGKNSQKSSTANVVIQSCLAAAYIPLWFGLFYREEPIILPISLAVAGSLTAHYYWQYSQRARELSLGVIVVAGLWALSVLNVDNLQIYTHLIAAVLAAYAYWRFRRAEHAASDAYLYTMFLTATIPLVLQALDGTSGDTYGWLLIVQQVGFMLLGITIDRKFLTWWGLYVSVAAVLYQLRHLGWAALTVLALFVIGVAVYRLLRAADKPPSGKSEK